MVRQPSPPLSGAADEGFGGAPFEADQALPARATKGRGAVSNPANRYETTHTVRVDDGWQRPAPESPQPQAPLPDDDEEPPRLQTTLTRDASRTIIARNTSPDIGFDRSINPYRGCEHGCIYCFARPTHAYLGLSPGLDFEAKLLFKPDAAALLRQELASPKYRCAVMAIGTNTDPYQPVERELKIMRSILQVLSETNHPVGIVTKSALITRDIDILADMAKRNLAEVFLSVTTLDRHLANVMEPRAATPARRLDAIRQLAAAGIPTGVMTAPMIPALNDHEMETILQEAVKRGATKGSYVLLRLPLEIGPMFEEWLRAHYPDRAERVLSLVRQTREGKLYGSDWGKRMRGTGPYAELLKTRFAAAARRLGLNQARNQLDTSRFTPPATARKASDDRQLSLL
jgi:DNA repair photolyase